jgi:hypothetical protein
MVPPAGLEPAHLSILDFESSASTIPPEGHETVSNLACAASQQSDAKTHKISHLDPQNLWPKQKEEQRRAQNIEQLPSAASQLTAIKRTMTRCDGAPKIFVGKHQRAAIDALTGQG